MIACHDLSTAYDDFGKVYFVSTRCLRAGAGKEAPFCPHCGAFVASAKNDRNDRKADVACARQAVWLAELKAIAGIDQ